MQILKSKTKELNEPRFDILIYVILIYLEFRN